MIAAFEIRHGVISQTGALTLDPAQWAVKRGNAPETSCQGGYITNETTQGALQGTTADHL